MRESLGAFHPAALLCCVFALAIAAPAIGEDSDDAKERGTLRARGFEEFDTDGDGRLSKDEQAAAREKRRKEFDADGDGKLSEAERTAARKQRSQRQLEHFDADGDGKLSEEERDAARGNRRGLRME